MEFLRLALFLSTTEQLQFNCNEFLDDSDSVPLSFISSYRTSSIMSYHHLFVHFTNTSQRVKAAGGFLRKVTLPAWNSTHVMGLHITTRIQSFKDHLDQQNSCATPTRGAKHHEIRCSIFFFSAVGVGCHNGQHQIFGMIEAVKKANGPTSVYLLSKFSTTMDLKTLSSFGGFQPQNLFSCVKWWNRFITAVWSFFQPHLQNPSWKKKVFTTSQKQTKNISTVYSKVHIKQHLPWKKTKHLGFV